MELRIAIGAGLVGAALVFGATAGAGQPTKKPTDPERGRELYDRHCVQCHGVQGHGDGPAAASLARPVPDLVGKVPTDDEAAKRVLDGQGLMPGFAQSFPRDDAKRVLAWMATLANAAAPPEAEPPPEAPLPVEPGGEDD